jgi:hypothetical protein
VYFQTSSMLVIFQAKTSKADSGLMRTSRASRSMGPNAMG